MLRITLLVLILLSPSLSFANPKVLVLGDSLSAGYGINYEQGWVNLLEKKLKNDHPEAKVINASISGDTSRGALARLPQALRTYQPDLVIVEIGGNDGLRGMSLKTIARNLDNILELIKESNSAAILVQMRIPLNYGGKYTQRFEALYQAASEKHNALLAPFILNGFVTDKEYMQSDRIHPKVNAQPLIVENIFPSVLEALSAMRFTHSETASDKKL